MATQTEDSGFLYFIVGGLVVVVALIGFIYLNDAEIKDGTPTLIERTERTIERQTDGTASGSDLRVQENTSTTSSKTN